MRQDEFDNAFAPIFSITEVMVEAINRLEARQGQQETAERKQC